MATEGSGGSAFKKPHRLQGSLSKYGIGSDGLPHLPPIPSLVSYKADPFEKSPLLKFRMANYKREQLTNVL